MTEHSKIPAPGQTRKRGPGESLIERAAGHFDFNSMIARPVPLPAEPVVSARPADDAASAAETPAVSSPASPPFAAPTPPPAPARDVAEPVAAAYLAPTAFAGEHHPIDRELLREQGLIVPEGTVTALLEEFRIVKRQLLVQAADLRRQKAGAAAQRVLISSPHPGEGKTYCALNLALSIAAEKESEVLLVDADFAKPSILSALGLPGGPGLMDALMDETIDPAECVLGTDIPGLWVMPAGDATINDSEYIASSRTARILDRLTENAPHRIVIFDSPPALAASPAAELAKYVGQTVVIVRADRTGQGALEDAISLLGACPNVQLLLNGTHFSPSGRRFGSYYGYKG
ncbi:capsular biosynthesis protein [Novosphingobium sp. ST904]|uniref:capsular biosynthesis protein n=1 Tax=Novosphingobium sp. ST904 TaxID=1684385 RepID=UPI0006C8E0B6|nr:capsular biosynthesis protein [Novosphingobium sp. ST904]KPH61669.1 capsular biosynthesis protein [Novosphingobium sp. ST904]TCM40728.1 Mrp family chromosome partitioning ATPase [Novosphingobium sp. ST904]